LSAAQWAFWLAIAALVAAAGKFLDDYYVKVTTKTQMRDALVGWFLWLDAHKVPDLGGAVLRVLRGVFQIRRFLLVAMSLAFAYWVTLSAFYVGREIFGPANDQSYTSYLLTWIPLDRSAVYWLGSLVAIIGPALLGQFTMGHCLHRATMTDSDARRLGLLAIGLIVGILLPLIGTILAVAPFSGGGYNWWIIAIAAVASIILPALLALCTLLLILIRYSIDVIRFLLLQVFDVASSPTVSPFT
jgi:hypothetical protein